MYILLLKQLEVFHIVQNKQHLLLLLSKSCIISRIPFYSFAFDLTDIFRSLVKKKTIMDHILAAQQGELDAEYMYNEMAKVVEKDYPEVAENFRKVARSEHAHYNVCAKITG